MLVCYISAATKLVESPGVAPGFAQCHRAVLLLHHDPDTGAGQPVTLRRFRFTKTACCFYHHPGQTGASRRTCADLSGLRNPCVAFYACGA